MLYHVSRGTQTYGPYTLADLERYVGSGHILLSDLAKSEEMAAWVPVGQILNPAPASVEPAGSYAQAPSASAQPAYYGAPAPAYGSPDAYPDPPNLNWVLVLLFDVLTCGVFQIVWNFVMAAWLRRVQPSSKAILYYALGYGLLFVYSGLSFPNFVAQMHHTATHLGLGLSAGLLGILAWTSRLVARFSMKASLEEHFNGPEPLGYHMNGVLLFFFGGLYLQAELNKINQIKQSMRYRDRVR